ncbi:MAG TPA: hypothetical protein VF045_08300, partial [Acidimicrobiales bacterium]
MTFDFTRRPRGERGIVGLNLVLVIAFALYAVIMLSRTTLAAKQIDDRVRVIVTEVGPGSNVSRLDETQKLNTIGQTAEDILRAAQPLSGQAQTIIDVSGSIDNTVSGILGNANEINATVKSINSTAAALLPVVSRIHGDESLDTITGGVAAINKRAETATPVVSGISNDLGAVFGHVGLGGTGGHGSAGLDTIHNDVNSINCALTDPSGGLLGTVGGLLNTILGGLQGAPPGCNLF